MSARSALTTIVAVSLSSSPLSATTCIAGKSFKVPQVCGIVTDKDGAVIPDATIHISPENHSEDAKEVTSDKDGRFAIPNVVAGEYQIRVKYSGFWDASQPFRVTGSRTSGKCTKQIRIVMKPAGQCSYVENAWPEMKKKCDLKGHGFSRAAENGEEARL